MNPEIMSPVGSYESLMAAIRAGANSVYFGIGELNMRARSAYNFTIKDLKKIVNICNKNKVKSYLTLNVVVYDNEFKAIKTSCDAAKKAKISAVIASDMAVIQYANKIKLPVHISTQSSVSNIEAVKFYSKFADVIVLARELTLEQVKNIVKEIKRQNIKGPNKQLVKIELFIHGAMCVSISGKCQMSLALYNEPANRGKCLQTCRRAYKVIDEETGDELIIDNKYVMSPKDLCTIGFIDKLIQAGVLIFKIEGRGRSPEYVYEVTKCYKEAINSIENNTYTKEKIANWTKKLDSVFNRGFWQGGYYLGKKLGDWSGTYGSKATTEKVYVGLIENYFPKPNVAQIKIESGILSINDEMLITGPTTGVLQFKLESLFVREKQAKTGKKGEDITIKVPNKVRKNDKVYVMKAKL
ncbi:MAG: peptidase U32 family protein [Nanoarchaeota archaeon]